MNVLLMLAFLGRGAGCIMLLVSSLFWVVLGGEPPKKEIRLIFRFDDPSARSDFEIETRLIKLFEENDMTCTWAIVPFVYSRSPYDSNRQDLLSLPTEKARKFAGAARTGSLEVALHGYSHQNNGLNPFYSEFAKLAYVEQCLRIAKGRRFLEGQLGVEVGVFVPPWNSYDSNTIRALESTGFKCLSADLGWPGDASSSLVFLPCTSSLTTLKQAVQNARNSCDTSPSIVVLFHQYDFAEYKGTRRYPAVMSLNEFAGVLHWLRLQPDVKVVPMSSVRNATSGLYVMACEQQKLNTRLPRLIRRRDTGVYFSSEEHYTSAKSAIEFTMFWFYGGIFILVGTASYLSQRFVLCRALEKMLTPRVVAWCLVLSGVLLILLSVVFFDNWFWNGGSKSISAVVSGLACWMGMCIVTIEMRGRRIKTDAQRSGSVS